MRTTKRQAADSIKEQAAVITGIEDTATVSEENQKFHPNFIESNTSGITLEELTEKNVIPTFLRQQLDHIAPEFHRCCNRSGRTDIRRNDTC